MNENIKEDFFFGIFFYSQNWTKARHAWRQYMVTRKLLYISIQDTCCYTLKKIDLQSWESFTYIG